jgi:hypothetical protein
VDQPVERRTRRQMLFGGLAAAAGLALGRFAQPDRAAAANGDPVIAGSETTATAATVVTNTTATNSEAFVAQAAGDSIGVRAVSDSGAAIYAWVGEGSGGSAAPFGVFAQVNLADDQSVGVAGHVDFGVGVRGGSTSGTGVLGQAGNNEGAGVAGMVGSGETLPTTLIDAGVYGLGGGGGSGTVGVWGDTATGAGVVGSGPWGVYGTGSIATTGDAEAGGTGVYGFVGPTAAPLPTVSAGVEARASSPAYLALNVVGRAKFSRSGRTLMAAGTSFITINLTGVTSGSLVFANLFTYRAGTWVIAATPTTGKFTIRLNKALTSSAYVVWFVLN